MVKLKTDFSRCKRCKTKLNQENDCGGYCVGCMRTIAPSLAEPINFEKFPSRKKAHIAKPFVKTCGICGQLLGKRFIKRGQANHVRCYSEKAKSRARVKIKTHDEYKEYLETEWWRERRKKTLDYYGGRCAVCNSAGLVDVHHRTYERLGQELDSDLIVLCRECHSRFHKNK